MENKEAVISSDGIPVTSDGEPLEEFGTKLQIIDDESIIADMRGHAIQDYVYSIKSGGRTIQGLTLAGINEAANRRGGLEIESIQYEETEDAWRAIAKAVDTVTGSSRYGACEQPKKAFKKDDPFAFTKAVHKAQRNALKQLIPVPVIKEVLSHYLEQNKKRK